MGAVRRPISALPPSNCEVVVFGFHQFGWRMEHAGSGREVRALFDENKGSSETIVDVAIEHKRFGSLQPDFADIICSELEGMGFRFEGLNVNAAGKGRDGYLHRLSSMF